MGCASIKLSPKVVTHMHNQSLKPEQDLKVWNLSEDSQEIQAVRTLKNIYIIKLIKPDDS